MHLRNKSPDRSLPKENKHWEAKFRMNILNTNSISWTKETMLVKLVSYSRGFLRKVEYLGAMLYTGLLRNSKVCKGLLNCLFLLIVIVLCTVVYLYILKKSYSLYSYKGLLIL